MKTPTITPETTISEKHNKELEEIRTRLTRERINEVIDGLLDVVASDQFIGYVNDISAIPSHEERTRMTAETANLDYLSELGLDVPPEMRLTTRQFEEPSDGRDSNSPLVKVNPALDPRMGFCGSAGFYVCGSYGG